MLFGAYGEIESKKINTYGIKIITGIEFDFVYEHKDFHMLGYNFNWKEINKSNLINKKTDEKQKLGYGVEGTVPITEEYLLKNI